MVSRRLAAGWLPGFKGSPVIQRQGWHKGRRRTWCAWGTSAHRGGRERCGQSASKKDGVGRTKRGPPQDASHRPPRSLLESQRPGVNRVNDFPWLLLLLKNTQRMRYAAGQRPPTRKQNPRHRKEPGLSTNAGEALGPPRKWDGWRQGRKKGHSESFD